MQIEIKLDETCKEPRVVIYACKVTEEVNSLVKRLSEPLPTALAGFCEDRVEILQPEEIVRIYAENQKVYAQTEKATYVLRWRLYEAEQNIGDANFIRISNSEIINLKRVKNLDLSLSGTIGVNLAGGIRTFVSRRYVAKIRSKLGI